MEAIQQAFLSGNLFAWGGALVLLVVIIQVIKYSGKILFLFAGLALVMFLISKFFPGIAAPISDFIGGSWMNNPK